MIAQIKARNLDINKYEDNLEIRRQWLRKRVLCWEKVQYEETNSRCRKAPGNCCLRSEAAEDNGLPPAAHGLPAVAESHCGFYIVGFPGYLRP